MDIYLCPIIYRNNILENIPIANKCNDRYVMSCTYVGMSTFRRWCSSSELKGEKKIALNSKVMDGVSYVMNDIRFRLAQKVTPLFDETA